MGGPPSPAHEGMQLYSTPVHEGLQPVEGNPYAYGPGGNPAIEPDSAPLSALSAQSAQAGGREVKYDSAPAPPYPGRRICGVAARVFWTIFGVVVLLVVIAAAVGGGVGGSQAARHAKEVSNASLVPVESSSSSAQISSSTQPSSSSTLTSISSLSQSNPSSSSSSISGAGSSPTSATTESSVTPSASESSSSTSASKSSAKLARSTPVPITGIVPLDCPNIDGSTYTSTSFTKVAFSVTCGSTMDAEDIGRTMAPSIKVCMNNCAGYPNNECKAIVFYANMTMAAEISGNCLFKGDTTGLQLGSYKLQASAVMEDRG